MWTENQYSIMFCKWFPKLKLMREPMKRSTDQPNATSQCFMFKVIVSFLFHHQAKVQINSENCASLHIGMKCGFLNSWILIKQWSLLLKSCILGEIWKRKSCEEKKSIFKIAPIIQAIIFKKTNQDMDIIVFTQNAFLAMWKKNHRSISKVVLMFPTCSFTKSNCSRNTMNIQVAFAIRLK